MILDNFSLKGKVAIVTGCGAGLGQGMAIGLAEAGADIAGVEITDMTETATAIGATGRRFLPIPANLSSTEPIERIMSTVKEEFGHVDILVNNAGIIRRADAVDFTEADWDDVMNINVKTLFFMTQAFAREVINEDRPGKVINIASLLSFQGGIRVPSYTASKSGVAGLTRLLANEWASRRINVNAIAPGYMATNNTAPLRADEARSTEILNRIPMGRWGLPEDLRGAVVFLASAASDYVTGHVMLVDGGWMGR